MCLVGCFQYLVFSKPLKLDGGAGGCDPLDSTECILPFPSNFYTVVDETTVTGRRVNVPGEALPLPRSGRTLDPGGINESDGFSTIAPILFYLPGLKERGGTGMGGASFPTPDEIGRSVTDSSTTLLIDVDAMQLIPHFSEIDSMDPMQPLVTLQPASPLSHNRHYAVALVNTVDDNDRLLAQSVGLTSLFSISSSDDTSTSRNFIFRNILLPSLHKAAPWLEPSPDPEKLPANVQVLFDFSTASEASQVGKLRDTRDATLDLLNADEFEWEEGRNVEVVKIVEGFCGPASFIARTVHLKISFPWFLSSYGSGHRGARLNFKALRNEEEPIVGSLKFIVQVPCSLKDKALNSFEGSELTNILEFGHGLFYSREELLDALFLQRMADANGYLLIAADWRGMSMFDLPIIAKVLMADPSLFSATRDNLIQGFVSKMAMLHYAKNGMLSAEFLKFDGLAIPVANGGDVEVSFYGISQGGVLGAGYNAMMGVTNLLQRSILGVPGTPFALILGRSTDFLVFNDIMLLNYYSSRHIRIMLSVIQHAWDGVEAGGLLAPPVNEPPPPVLIQAGLGDAEVPSVAAEILARAYKASLLPGSPKPVFGLDTVPGARAGNPGPGSALTEIMYDFEYRTVPRSNAPVPFNSVHNCVRQDYALQQQIVMFVDGEGIMDPCSADGCFRSQAWC